MQAGRLKSGLKITAVVLLASGLTAYGDVVNLTIDSSVSTVNGYSTDGNTAGSYGVLNGAAFVQAGIAPSGTGVIDSFLRVSTNSTFEQGYNTSARPKNSDPGTIDDDNASGNFTRDLPLNAVPIFTCGIANFNTADSGCASGTSYYQFELDINQQGSDPLLTLTRLAIYDLPQAGATIDKSSFPAGTQLAATGTDPFGAGVGTKLYDSGQGNQVLLNYDLEPGSGKGDAFVYVPVVSGLAANSYIYLYSEFGAPGVNDTTDANGCTGDPTMNQPTTCGNGVQAVQGNNDGYEEWAVTSSVLAPAVPEPASMILLGTAFMLSMKLLRKKVQA
jgi:hypothetical protein